MAHSKPVPALTRPPFLEIGHNHESLPDPDPVEVVAPFPLDGSTDTAIPCATVTETVAVLM